VTNILTILTLLSPSLLLAAMEQRIAPVILANSVTSDPGNIAKTLPCPGFHPHWSLIPDGVAAADNGKSQTAFGQTSL